MRRNFPAACHPFNGLVMKADVLRGFACGERQLEAKLQGPTAFDEPGEVPSGRLRRFQYRPTVAIVLRIQVVLRYEEAGFSRRS